MRKGESLCKRSGYHSDGVKTVCKCPKCGKMHQLRMLWIGNGVPRKFCNGCNSEIAKYDMDSIPDEHTMLKRKHKSRVAYGPLHSDNYIRPSEWSIIPAS